MRGRASPLAALRMLYVLGLLTLCVTQTYGADTLSHILQQRSMTGGLPGGLGADPLDAALRRQCPPAVSILDCYIRVMALMHEDGTRAALVARLQRECPPSTNHFRCFYSYVNNVLNIRAPGAGMVAPPSGRVSKRQGARYQLCPLSMRTVDCFDSYMALWLKLVTSQEGKRTFAGKRSSGGDFGGFYEGADGDEEEAYSKQDGGCVERFGREACLRKEIRDLARSIQDGRKQELSKQQQLDDYDPKRKRSMASVCRDTDPVKCFEHYIFQLARYESKKQKVKGFIGK